MTCLVEKGREAEQGKEGRSAVSHLATRIVKCGKPEGKLRKKREENKRTSTSQIRNLYYQMWECEIQKAGLRSHICKHAFPNVGPWRPRKFGTPEGKLRKKRKEQKRHERRPTFGD